MRLRPALVLTPSLAATLLASPGASAQRDAAHEAPETLGTRARAEASFDPDGATDDAGYKDPFWPYEELLGAVDTGEPTLPDPVTAAPSNDLCANATIIPGSAVTYSPTVYSTTTATTEVCEGSESCGGLGTSRTVYYRYTPDNDGTIEIDTFGSTYDTVLSVWRNCGFQSGIFCVLPTEVACNNDASFGTQSQLYVGVSAGQTYLVKIGAAFGSGGGNLDFDLRYLPPNDNCPDAIEVAGDAYAPPLLSTHNADLDVCEPNESCEINGSGVSNSVWYRYTAPCDGFLDLNTNGSSYDTVLSVWDGCPSVVGGTTCIYPNELACDDDSGTATQSQITGLPVEAGETYVIKVADYNTSAGGGYLDFHLVFDGSNPPTADLLSPGDFTPVCGTAIVQGTADSNGGYVSWSLDYKATNGGAWTPIASSTAAVVGGTLAPWNASALPSGYYLLRLTVTNACGLTETDTSVVWVDDAFSSLDLRSPFSGLVLGQVVVLDGTAWDPYFGHYTLGYRPAASATYSPIDPGTAQYGVPVTNDPLAPGGWDTVAAGIPDGSYVVRLQGVDQCGFSAEETSTVTIDNTPPVATITWPRPGDRAKGRVSVSGTATDANLAAWVLQVTGGKSTSWSTVAQGTSPVAGGTLGVWDTRSVAPGPYTLRLVVTDSSLLNGGSSVHRSEFLVSVDVGKVVRPHQPTE